MKRVAAPYEQARITETLDQLGQDLRATMQQYGFDPSKIDSNLECYIDEQGLVLSATCSTNEIICIGN